LVLPAMHKYGRLAPADAAPLLAAEAKGRPYLPRYRGAAHLPPREQVAEVAAREALTGASCAAAITPVDEDRYDVTLGKSTVRVACYPETLRAYGACEDLLAAKPLEPKTVWRGEVLSITPKKEPTP
ncbi:MAG: sucrase ferredoxin, partial [Pseudomonadota bacterium]